MLGQAQATVAVHCLRDVDKQRLWDGELGEALEDVDHLLRVVTGGAGIPQRQRGDAVGVHMFGSTFELRERCQRRACRIRLRIIDLQQHRLIRLDDQRTRTETHYFLASQTFDQK